MNEPTTVIGLIFGLGSLIISNIAMWIREYQKSKARRLNGSNIGEIKQDIDETKTKIESIDEKMGATREDIASIKTDMAAMKSNCLRTTSRFATEISENREKIYNLTKRKRK